MIPHQAGFFVFITLDHPQKFDITQFLSEMKFHAGYLSNFWL